VNYPGFEAVHHKVHAIVGIEVVHDNVHEIVSALYNPTEDPSALGGETSLKLGRFPNVFGFRRTVLLRRPGGKSDDG
jgi:hypothetical protein